MKRLIFILLFVLSCPLFVLATDKIDINNASLIQLEELTGIGPKYAQAIIDARPFSSLDDLLKVKGIGPKTLQKIKDQGLAYIDEQSQQSAQESTLVEALAPTTEQVLISTTTYSSEIFINEILPNPEGTDEAEEWVELYNPTHIDVDLSDWKIQDTMGTIETYTIPKNTNFLANSFLIFRRPETKIMLNNDNDGLNLLTPDKKVVDSVNFVKAPLGQSYNRINSSWQWSRILTPSSTNSIAITQTKNNSKTLPKNKNSVNNNGIEAGLADISQTINTNQDNNKIIKNPWFLFFTAMATAIISAVIVLLIKLRFRKGNNPISNT